ncbi:IucA/IucC family protein [Pseudoduganella namucuonensis]|uniref:Ferric iron reductase FhuF-like transporter n=1 Tax=Pseudoduganella namucuonensis TaxID=1035707 RepID=A0A1I7JE45_9BURK|nr:IucA/IucC family protein [Pseudoduganella namucuonensis]SFU83418.1 Ferric iron reductase FhuF-like transporter [Pseudoduganella namucuonensis]
MKAAPDADAGDPRHVQYIRQRVLDALLREDVRGCVSGATLVASEALPPGAAALEAFSAAPTGAAALEAFSAAPTGVAALELSEAPPPGAAAHARVARRWLRVGHFEGGMLWIPVLPARFMQVWRSAGLPLLWREHGAEPVALNDLAGVLACYARGLPPQAAALFRAFGEECDAAVGHRVHSESERERWFAELRGASAPRSVALAAAGGAPAVDWQASLLYHDRVAAFHDHPLYPTARAKLGFDEHSLAAYGPECQREFQLRWLALPRDIHHPSADARHWPALWPSFADVGLDPALADSHALLPVHPFMWGAQLQAMLEDAKLAQAAIPAPRPWLRVAPTLSVRTVVLLDAPEWHVKVPLTIRTLGARNIRTIKPSTIRDGHAVQTLLGAIAAHEPGIGGRLLLTDERCGAHADHRMFLGYILRRYPDAALQGCDVVPIAALAADAPHGGIVAQDLARRHYGGDLLAFFDDYLDLTLNLHLTLWTRYGVALESNQQNSVLVLGGGGPLRLLLKDNDAARIHTGRLRQRWPLLAAHVAELRDDRIAVNDELPLAQMFTTITLQLNIAVLAESYAVALDRPPAALYALVRRRVDAVLARLDVEGEDTALARHVLLDSEWLHLKCLLVAATLAEKSETGAADVNKFYGRSAPNFLRQA